MEKNFCILKFKMKYDFLSFEKGKRNSVLLKIKDES